LFFLRLFLFLHLLSSFINKDTFGHLPPLYQRVILCPWLITLHTQHTTSNYSTFYLSAIMDSWSRGGRGRGNRGRGRGDYNNSYNSNYSNNNGGGDSGGGILSRLGPMADGNSGFSTNNFHQQQQQQPQQGRGRGGYQNNNSFDQNNSHSSYQQQGRGRGGYQNNNFDQNNNNSNYQQSPRGGRNQTFSSRGRGRGGRGGNNQGGRGQQFTRDLADDDIDMGHDM
jgi:hypothetical protein